jgi:hypothetical protein
MRPFRWPDILSLLLVLVVAGGLRAGYLYYYADLGRNEGICRIQGDFYQNEGITWYGPRPPAQDLDASYSPGYPYLLAWIKQISPDDPVRAGSLVRWLQCGVSAITAALYFLFARRAFRSLVVGALAGLAVAANPFAIANIAEFNDGVVTSFLLALVLLLGTRANEEFVPVGSIFYGLSLAALSLFRAACLPFAFVAMVWYLLRCRTLGRGWLCAFLAFLAFVNGLAPWTVRNVQVLGEAVPIVDSTYFHLWIGNNPQATGGSPMLVVMPIPGRGPQRYDSLAPRVVDEVRNNPLATMRRRLAAAGFFLFGEQFFNDHRLAAPVGDTQPPAGVEEALTGVLLGAIPLALLGWRWSYAWRRESMPAALAVIWLPLPYLLAHAEWLHGPRLPLDGLFLTFAAFGLLCLIPGYGKTLRHGQLVAVEPSPTRPGPLPPTSAPPASGRGPSWH